MSGRSFGSSFGSFKREPAAEGAPLNEQEAAVLRKARAELGHELGGLPRDMIPQFVRGYLNDPDWAASVIKFMRETTEWRQRERCDEILHPEQVPDKRAEFERMWRTAVIGEDGCGHPIVIESLGRIPAHEFQAAFSEELFLRHCVYNKEVLRKLCIHTSRRLSQRVYKFVVILDLQGLAMAHTSRAFIHLIKTYISSFSNFYPESLKKLYIVNAPFIFTGVWQVVRQFLHPLTAAKIAIVGSFPKAMQVRAGGGAVCGRWGGWLLRLGGDALGWWCAWASSPRPCS
jgi:hypothetical protein